MGIFAGGEYVDYTEWKKRGLIKVEEKKLPAPMDKSGMLDFTQEAQNSQEATPVAQTETMPSFGFLDSPLRTGPVVNSEMSELKIKMDDVMFKLDQMIERIASIERRLGG